MQEHYHKFHPDSRSIVSGFFVDNLAFMVYNEIRYCLRYGVLGVTTVFAFDAAVASVRLGWQPLCKISIIPENC